MYLLETPLTCVINLCTCIYTIEASVKVVTIILLTKLYISRVTEILKEVV